MVALAAVLFAPAASASADSPTTPASPRAYIFDALGGHPDSLAAEQQIKTWLQQDGYGVTMWSDPTEGIVHLAGPAFGITLTNFVKMAGAGVVVINSHGDPDGIAAEFFPHDAVGQAEQLAEYHRYLDIDHWKKAWIRKGSAHISGPNIRGRDYALGLTAAGIAHFFGASHTGIVFSTTCEGAPLASSFNAQAFVGYAELACSSNAGAAGDLRRFFMRLAGLDGIARRSTTSAWGAGGFGSIARFSSKAPLTLAPAVTRVTPASGATVGTGKTKISVNFDTVMLQKNAKQAVSAYGHDCGGFATKNALWASPTSLTFTLVVPKNATGCKITLAVAGSRAKAGGGGWPAYLDGNQQPSPQSGAVPNDTDYTWDVMTMKKKSHAKHHHPRRPRIPAACMKAKGRVCVIFDGTSNTSFTAPALTAVSGKSDAKWHLVWTLSQPGYGVPDTLERSSTASGHNMLTEHAGVTPPTCSTGFTLSTVSPASLTEGDPYNPDPKANTNLTIDVPNPTIDSAGGSGSPAIVVTNPNCPPVQSSVPPGNFPVKVRLRPGVTTQPVSGKGSNNQNGNTYAGKLSGTVTVVVR